MNVLEILASAVGFDKVRAEMDETATGVRAATGGMSEAFQALATESQTATTQISSAFIQAAEATVVSRQRPGAPGVARGEERE
jgi:hypothetical protein